MLSRMCGLTDARHQWSHSASGVLRAHINQELCMFESAEIGHAIDDDTYEADLPDLREALLEAQIDLHEQAGRQIIVLINGIEGAG
ncbi:hypothetical protein ALQ64_05719, partial [Pseudomonas cannabina]